MANRERPNLEMIDVDTCLRMARPDLQISLVQLAA